MKTTLEKNTKYQAEIKLDVLESFASNDMIKQKLAQAGFKEIVVEGKGASRSATGIWPGETQTAEIPKQISSIKKL